MPSSVGVLSYALTWDASERSRTCAVEPRSAPRAEHRRGQVERRRVVVPRAGRAPPHRELRLLHVARELAVPEARRGPLRRSAVEGRRALGDVAVARLDLPQRVLRVDVAHHRQDGGARAIERAVEARHVTLREAAQSLLGADAPAAHAMLVVQQRIERLDRHRARVVELALRLLDDDLELPRQLAGVDQRVGVGVGLDVEPLDEARRRQHGVVARVVVDRVRVEIAALGLGLLRDLAHAAARRALEEHVLEHVRHADDVVRLVEVAGAHEGVDRDDRRRGVAPDEHGEAVREHGAVHRGGIEQLDRIGRGHRADGGASRGRGGRAGRDEAPHRQADGGWLRVACG
jgi:hypothetical protein